jgi:hypothetical protein
VFQFPSLLAIAYPITCSVFNQSSIVLFASEVPLRIGFGLLLTMPSVPESTPMIGAAGGVVSIVIVKGSDAALVFPN